GHGRGRGRGVASGSSASVVDGPGALGAGVGPGGPAARLRDQGAGPAPPFRAPRPLRGGPAGGGGPWRAMCPWYRAASVRLATCATSRLARRPTAAREAALTAFS